MWYSPLDGSSIQIMQSVQSASMRIVLSQHLFYTWVEIGPVPNDWGPISLCVTARGIPLSPRSPWQSCWTVIGCGKSYIGWVTLGCHSAVWQCIEHFLWWRCVSQVTVIFICGDGGLSHMRKLLQKWSSDGWPDMREMECQSGTSWQGVFLWTSLCSQASWK